MKNQLIHGGDYNPDQWLAYPEKLDEDIRFMKEANVNCVSLGIFSWTLLEPSDEMYDVEWLAQIIDRLYGEGIYTILATPSGALPHWMTRKYPETMQVQANGVRNLPGKRHNFCYTSKTMRRKIKDMNEVLAKRFGHHDAVILWHISNELGNNFTDASCHCEECQNAFREWLKKKYQTIEAVNHAWWNGFWSHHYTDWEEIHSPAEQGETHVHGLNLDWRRFVSDQMTDYCAWEIAALRKYSDKPVTTNFMDFFKWLDYSKMHQILDVVSWDNYPFWHKIKDETVPAVRAAANHDLMRSLKKKPFLMMESTPSCINWREFNPVKRPGMHMLSSMQAIAHGSDSVQYFQWRQGRGSFEKFHGAVVGHRGGNDTRVFREVRELGQRMQEISPSVLGAANIAKMAMVFDWENWWSLEDISGVRDDIDYVEEILKHYRAFWEQGITVDFISMDDELEGYELIVAPYNYMYKKAYIDKVRNYVRDGGTYVTTYFSGLADETDLCFLEHHPLCDVLGVAPEEIDAPGEGFANHTSFDGRQFELGNIREVVHPLEGTQILAVYEEDYCRGKPVLTKHGYGDGSAYYIAAKTEVDFLRALYQNICKDLKLNNPLGVSLPAGVSVAERKKDGSSCVFVMNFNDDPVTLNGIGMWNNVEEEVEIPGFGCVLLEK